eukprot:2380688-Amphidinium_carterae.1
MAEVENLKSALADVIKKAQNQNVLLDNTAWTQRPPDGLRKRKNATSATTSSLPSSSSQLPLLLL